MKNMSMTFEHGDYTNSKRFVTLSHGYKRLHIVTGGVSALYAWIMVCAVLSTKAVSIQY
jgi:hypothetical protein